MVIVSTMHRGCCAAVVPLEFVSQTVLVAVFDGGFEAGS